MSGSLETLDSATPGLKYGFPLLPMSTGARRRASEKSWRGEVSSKRRNPEQQSLLEVPTHRLLSSSFLGLPYRILNMNHKQELLRSLWVCFKTKERLFMQKEISLNQHRKP